MKTAKYLIAGMIALFSFSVVLAETIPHEEAGVQIWLPSNWSAEAEGDNVLTAASPSEDIAFVFAVMGASQIDAAMDELDSTLSEIVENPQAEGEAEEVTVNGMEGVFVEGTGSIDGTPVSLGVLLLMTPTGKVLMVLGIVETSKEAEYDAVTRQIIMGIKPLN